MNTRQKTNTAPFSVVGSRMTSQELNIITMVCNDMALLMKLENNPYSLTLNELKVLRSHDRLNVKLDALKRDVLAQKALSNSLKYRV